ncbi:ABC transporter B family member 11-like [Lolium rigidum]|uniref:ABC transporter B family member 11-like n=1 Tax=Lolium rigidum TaxID=89674 RepID=UPI001F5D8A98|nr:ABC transporter B family member 11-like [Lolium rigidum]
MVLIQDAIGEKVGKFLQLVSTFLGGFINAFARGWLLSLSYAQIRLTRGFGADAKEIYEQASTIARDASSVFMLPFYVRFSLYTMGQQKLGKSSSRVRLLGLLPKCKMQLSPFSGLLIGYPRLTQALR